MCRNSPTLILLLFTVATMAQATERRIAVSFSGGHETDPRDRGRPVVLIAAALDVKPEIFREAFSGVTPARGRGPTGAEARRNKQALMRVLGPHNVTNERLDEVSNYYRYRPQAGELWPTKPARAHALVEDGQIKKIVVTDPGSGYSSTPTVTVKGFEKAELVVEVKYGTNLQTNGSIASVDIVRVKTDATLTNG